MSNYIDFQGQIWSIEDVPRDNGQPRKGVTSRKAEKEKMKSIWSELKKKISDPKKRTSRKVIVSDAESKLMTAKIFSRLAV